MLLRPMRAYICRLQREHDEEWLGVCLSERGFQIQFLLGERRHIDAKAPKQPQGVLQRHSTVSVVRTR